MIDDATIEAYQPGPEERAFLERIKGRGHASVIGPKGEIVAGPLEGGEGILYADVDLNDVLIPKLMHDFTGHYNRFDIFSLRVNTDVPRAVAFTGADSAPRGQPCAGEEALPSQKRPCPP